MSRVFSLKKLVAVQSADYADFRRLNVSRKGAKIIKQKKYNRQPPTDYPNELEIEKEKAFHFISLGMVGAD